MSILRSVISGILSILLILSQTTITKGAIDPNSYPAPKIGLALGGGSAGGFAHIGVLKWLEEHQIPVSYIAGTSMGGLMGGCYAMGMSPSEITALVTGINWNELFNPNPPYAALDFRRKEDIQQFSSLEIGYLNGGVRLPSGLAMFRVDLVLSRITSAYPTNLTFDQLPVPFKCIATDIQNMQPVVFDSGSLKEAMRATMAIPGVFTPVELKDKLLIDGGVLNNVPVEVVKDMGSEVVIAVNIAAPIRNREFETIDSVLMKTIDTVIADNAQRSSQAADIVLAPSFEGLGLLQWNNAPVYIELGYQAAEAAKAALLPYALNSVQWQQYCLQRQQQRHILQPTQIEVHGTSLINTATIQGKLLPLLDETLDLTLLETYLTQLMGSGLYESLSYEFIIKDQQPVLVIKAKEKAYGPPFIRFGMNLETSGLSSDNSSLNLGSRLTSFNLTGPGSELRMDFSFGSDANFNLELYQPIAQTNFFGAPALFANSSNNSLFHFNTRIGDYRTTKQGIRFDLGYAPSKKSELRLGYVAGNQALKTKVGKIIPDQFDGSYQAVEFNWVYRSTEQLSFPSAGLDLELKTNWFLTTPAANSEFGLASAKARRNRPLGDNASLVTALAGGTSTQDLPLPQQFRLGGPFRLSAYSFDQFQGDHYILGAIGYLRKIPKWSKLSPVYVGCWLENGAAFDSWDELDLTSDLSIGLITPTLFGPLTLGTSFSEDSNQTLFMVLGHTF